MWIECVFPFAIFLLSTLLSSPLSSLLRMHIHSFTQHRSYENRLQCHASAQHTTTWEKERCTSAHCICCDSKNSHSWDQVGNRDAGQNALVQPPPLRIERLVSENYQFAHCWFTIVELLLCDCESTPNTMREVWFVNLRLLTEYTPRTTHSPNLSRFASRGWSRKLIIHTLLICE